MYGCPSQCPHDEWGDILLYGGDIWTYGGVWMYRLDVWIYGGCMDVEWGHRHMGDIQMPYIKQIYQNT